MRESILGQKKRHSRSGELGNLHFLSDIKILGSFASHRQKPVGEKLGAAWRRKRGQKKIFRRQKLVGRWSWFVLLRWLISSPWLFGCSSSTIDFWLGLMRRRMGEAAGWGRLGGCCFSFLEWGALGVAKITTRKICQFWLDGILAFFFPIFLFCWMGAALPYSLFSWLDFWGFCFGMVLRFSFLTGAHVSCNVWVWSLFFAERQCTARCLQRVAPRIIGVYTLYIIGVFCWVIFFNEDVLQNVVGPYVASNVRYIS